MRRRLSRPGTHFLLLAALLVVGLLGAVSSASPDETRPLALDSAKPQGALALYVWAQRAGYARERSDALHLGSLPETHSTALLLNPPRELSTSELRSLRRWARRGGRAVLVSDVGLSRTFSRLGFPIVPAIPGSVRISEPLLLNPPTARLDGRADVVGLRLAQPGTVAATASGSVLVKRTIGKGTVWLLTAPELLDNQHLQRADNRRLALNLLGAAGDRVRFTELRSNSGASQGGSWVTNTVWGVAVLFLLAVSLLYRWLGGWRLGPPRIPFGERRRPAVEYVLSMADLLRRARRRDAVLQIYQRGLRHSLRKRLGADDPELLRSPLREEIRQALAPAGAMDEDDLLRRVDHILQCDEEVREARV